MNTISIGAIHHIMMTVSDIQRTRTFYNEILGMEIAAENPDGSTIAFTNGSLLLAARLPFDPDQTPKNDRFSEHRMGLDHLSLSVDSREDLETAVSLFNKHNIPHGEIKDLSERGFPMMVLAFRDPDNIQLELTAPVAGSAN